MSQDFKCWCLDNSALCQDHQRQGTGDHWLALVDFFFFRREIFFREMNSFHRLHSFQRTCLGGVYLGST